MPIRFNGNLFSIAPSPTASLQGVQSQQIADPVGYAADAVDAVESTDAGISAFESTEQAAGTDEDYFGANEGLAASDDVSNINYIIVQSFDPLDQEQRERLLVAGVEFLQYLEDNAWLCRYEPPSLASIRGLPGIKAVEKIPPMAKIPSQLQNVDDRESVSDDCKVDVVIHGKSTQTAQDIAGEISRIANVPVDAMSIRRDNTIVRVVIGRSKLTQIAALDNVASIQQVVPLRLHNNVARQILQVETHPKAVPFNGKDQVVTVADSGFDVGDPDKTHPAFKGRIVKLVPIRRQNPPQTDDENGHGTHVCGSVLGDGICEEMRGVIQGTAPGAKLIMQALLGPDSDGEQVLFGQATESLADLLSISYKLGSRIHTNSWGPEWDANIGQLPYDATDDLDNFIWKHPEMVVVFSAGNDGEEDTSKGHIGAQNGAKNCITVGSCDSPRPTFDKDYKKFSVKGNLKGDTDHVSVFSSRGPTFEDRIKPDVIAPGAMILSTASKALVSVATTFGESKSKDWMWKTGTSMSAPLVAGCIAVLREGLQSGGMDKPNAALLKAMLINGATDLGSSRREQGFGRVNIANSIIIPGKITNRDYWEGEIQHTYPPGLATKKVSLRPYLGQTATHGANLKATLVYNDLSSASLQINLNLVIRCDVNGQTQTRHGNADLVGADGYDYVNNVEQFVWKGLPADAVVELEVSNRVVMNAPSASFAVVFSVEPVQ